MKQIIAAPTTATTATNENETILKMAIQIIMKPSIQ